MTRRILVIDDSQLMREAARLGLARGGWAIDTAEDGPAGLAAAQASPPDAILLDLTMPGMEGPEVLERLRADDRTAGVPVVLLTASTDEAAGLPADGVVAKPFSPLEIADQVRTALGWEP
ncbi:response regulator [Patulibacter sp. SYSU D01012]|uniref:response regulator n=1 Tax=Patulibacter sp. SYSU D01012 TaxID=2817381 RepID=UPI001B30705E